MTLEMCKVEDEAKKDKMKENIEGLNLDEIPKSDWEYRKPDDIISINNRLSKDLSLFYTVSDVRKLFNWRQPVYHNICKLVSQQYVGFSPIAIKSKLNLLMSIQAVLTELDVFNLLSEDKEKR